MEHFGCYKKHRCSLDFYYTRSNRKVFSHGLDINNFGCWDSRIFFNSGVGSFEISLHNGEYKYICKTEFNFVFLQEYENFNDFATVDDDVAVCEGLEDSNKTVDEEEELDNEEVIPVPTREDIFSAVDVLKNYAATNNVSIGFYEFINRISFECADRLKTIVCKEAKIGEYFNNNLI